jgi:hypothetical protein
MFHTFVGDTPMSITGWNTLWLFNNLLYGKDGPCIDDKHDDLPYFTI